MPSRRQNSIVMPRSWRDRSQPRQPRLCHAQSGGIRASQPALRPGADILALPADLGPFDLIECSGVLHHLQDPMAGWRILRDRLRPGGIMKVSLYSEQARRHVVAARALIAERGWPADAEGIRRCRAEIFARDDDPLFAKLATERDLFSLSLCRDLIFHVQEHRFSLPQVAQAMAELGLEFLGLEGPDTEMRRRYKTRFPDDPHYSDLANWAAFEAVEPDCFAEMIQLLDAQAALDVMSHRERKLPQAVTPENPPGFYPVSLAEASSGGRSRLRLCRRSRMTTRKDQPGRSKDAGKQLREIEHHGEHDRRVFPTSGYP